jgi:uncharacterized integral membrane protein
MKITTALWLVPLAVIAALIAVANREDVVFRFNPFAPDDPVYATTMPLFALVFLAFLAGTLVGGVTFAVRRALNDRRKRRAAKAAADATKTPPLDAGREGGSQSPP